MTALVFVACVVVGVFVACVAWVATGGSRSSRSDAPLVVGFGFVVGFLGLLGLLSFRGLLGLPSFLGFLGDVVVGVVAGVGVVVVGGLLLLVVIVVVEVGQRRGAQVPAHLRAVSPLAPRTLQWVRGLLPGDEGTAWLAEVGSCLAETTDKGERRRYARSYRRKVPQLIWTSWAEHLSTSRSRELS